MLENMDLTADEKEELLEAREMIQNGCKTVYAFEPQKLDPTKFRDLSTVGKIRFLNQATKFLDLGIYIGGWPYLKTTLDGEEMAFVPVFDVERKDRPNDPRIISNGSATQLPHAFLSRNLATENTRCRLM